MGGWTAPSPGGDSYALASWLFLRVLGLIYLAAFSSLAAQIKGLVGDQGILPARQFLQSHRRLGRARFWRIPTLCWINPSERFLVGLIWGGIILSILLILGVAPLLALILLWVFYLSLFSVCRMFLGYQWDILLLETGFLAMFLAPLELWPTIHPLPAPSPIILWLFWWLLFRLMFSSGVMKLRSGDQSWRNLTALCHHYETQPLPTPIAWFVHQLPPAFHRMSTGLTLAIEVLVPFLIFTPVPLRYVACFLFISLMVLIQLTGNYAFFNLLGIALSLLLLDDKVLMPLWEKIFAVTSLRTVPAVASGTAFVVAVLILILSIAPILRLFRVEMEWPRKVASIFEFLDRLRLVNSYGLFALMTRERPEIIIEGSRDGFSWLAYEFKWKPDDVKRAPRFVAPHQPRLDWQMWFAALGYADNHSWFIDLLNRLLEGSPAVLALLKTNPFPDTPPRYVRGVVYDYRFTDRALRRATGAWWRRERRELYAPVIEAGESYEA